MKLFKRILSLVCILATLVLLIQAPVANASTDIIFNETYYENISIGDEFEYYFEVYSRTDVTFKLSSDLPVDIYIEDYSYDYEDDYYEVTELDETITLSKGSYWVTIEASEYIDCECCWDCYCDWDDGCYCDCSDCVYNSNNDSGIFSFGLHVKNARKLNFNNNKITLKPGKTKKLYIQTTPSFAYVEDLYWWSSNEAVAKVNQKGKVTAKSWGKATIYAEDGNKTAKCTVIVNGNKTIKIHVGSTLNLPKINGKRLSGWKSKNTSIAVGGKTVTGKGGGTTTVYKKLGGVTYSCKIKVTNPYTLLSKGKSKLKSDYLYFPSYFQPQTAWRGYWDGDWLEDYDDNTPAVLLKYRARNLYGYMITEYAIFYNSGFDGVYYEIYSSMPTKSEFRKRVVL